MSEQESYYRHNEEYAEFLANWDANFYAKYADTLKPDRPGGKALDVGCGVGQVVARLTEAGFEAYGVDVSEPSIARAKKFCPRCEVYDGTRLPFADNFFDSAGALNVLEHVDQPEGFIQEVIRVVAPGGKVVISSPNFLRAIGIRDYHPKMRGLGNKANMIVGEVSYEVTDPTVDSQVVKLKSMGVDLFYDASTPKFAANV